MPNKENIRKWVTALRSGEYEQGTGSLNENGKKCCLGVACEVMLTEQPDSLQVGEASTGDNEGEFRVTYDGEGGYLPHSVMTWLGFDHINPVLMREGPENHPVSATTLNDTLRLTFPEIADAIEKTYLTE